MNLYVYCKALKILFTMSSTSDLKAAIDGYLQTNCAGIGHRFSNMLQQSVGGACKIHNCFCTDDACTDVLICGFPCQPYSTKSNRSLSVDPSEHDLYAIHELEVLIRNRNPLIVILENVLGFMRVFGTNERSELKKLMKMIRRLGYNIDYTVLSGNVWLEGFRGMRIYNRMTGRS